MAMESERNSARTIKGNGATIVFVTTASQSHYFYRALSTPRAVKHTHAWQNLTHLGSNIFPSTKLNSTTNAQPELPFSNNKAVSYCS